MSTKCTIAYTRHLHIYSCCNTNWAICLSGPDMEDTYDSYNGDPMIRHAELYDLYQQLQKYFSLPIEQQYVSYVGYGESGPDRE
jgi:hypothetical protein